MNPAELSAALRRLLSEAPCEGAYPAVGEVCLLTPTAMKAQIASGIVFCMHRDYLVRMVTFLESQAERSST